MSGPNIGQAQPGLLEATSAADRECMVNTLSMLEQARKGPLPWLETFDALKCAGVTRFLNMFDILHPDVTPDLKSADCVGVIELMKTQIGAALSESPGVPLQDDRCARARAPMRYTRVTAHSVTPDGEFGLSLD